MKTLSNQKGASIIAVIAIMLILAVMGVALVSLVTTGSDISTNQLQSEQALQIAVGGLEYEAREIANVSPSTFYSMSSDPFTVISSANLGAGSFTVTRYLPATQLSKKFRTTDGTANVYTTQRFPPAPCALCLLQIDNVSGNPEFVKYTAIPSSTTLTIPTTVGTNRGVTVGTVSSSPNNHSRGDIVYPVATLITPLTSSASCATAITPDPIQINAVPIPNFKFLSAGTIMVIHNCTLDTCAATDYEQITYTGSYFNAAGTVMNLTGVQRCQNGTTTAITASAGDPVTSLQVNSATLDYEVESVSTGKVISAQRVIKKTTQR